MSALGISASDTSFDESASLIIYYAVPWPESTVEYFDASVLDAFEPVVEHAGTGATYRWYVAGKLVTQHRTVAVSGYWLGMRIDQTLPVAARYVASTFTAVREFDSVAEAIGEAKIHEETLLAGGAGGSGQLLYTQHVGEVQPVEETVAFDPGDGVLIGGSDGPCQQQWSKDIAACDETWRASTAACDQARDTACTAAYLNFTAQVDKMKWDSAAAHGQFGGLVGGGLAAIGGAAVTVFCVSNPVGWAVGAALAIGTVGGGLIGVTSGAIVAEDNALKQCEATCQAARIAHTACTTAADTARQTCYDAADSAQDDCLANQP